jgi:hypothetical protein
MLKKGEINMKKIISKSLGAVAGLVAAVVAVQGVSLVGAASGTDSASEPTVVSLSVGPTISLTLNDASRVLTGTALGQLYTSGEIVAKVITNHSSGYNLTLSAGTVAGKNGLYLLTDLDQNCPNGGCFMATGNTADFGDLENNRWGVYYNTTTNPSPVGFRAVPAFGSSLNIRSKDGTALTPGEDTYVTFGAKPTDALPSGSYRNTVIFTATVK